MLRRVVGASFFVWSATTRVFLSHELEKNDNDRDEKSGTMAATNALSTPQNDDTMVVLHP